MPNLPTSIDLHYVAGLLEGEGYFISKRGIFIGCRMTDVEPLEKLQRLCGGTITLNDRHAKNSKLKPIFQWRLGRTAGAIQLAQRLYSLMSPRRQGQIQAMLNAHLRSKWGRHKYSAEFPTA